MNIQELRAEIERRIAERLPAVLLEKGVVSHAKYSYRRGCSCSYCRIKREATLCIGSASFTGIRKINTYCLCTTEEIDSIKFRKKQTRQALRAFFRDKMNDALTEL